MPSICSGAFTSVATTVPLLNDRDVPFGSACPRQHRILADGRAGAGASLNPTLDLSLGADCQS